MLALINNVWEGGCLPKEWKHAVIIPIVKPGKQADSPSSYRPIALTSVLCKIMERMITDRIVDKLEKGGFFVTHQNGFRQGRSTMDAVLSLDMDIKKAMANKEAVVAVFLEIEKAYDMLWKEGLQIALYDAGIRGRMFNWIRIFLCNRSIQVRIGSELSDDFEVENGTPQGSVISLVLFNIIVNGMFSRVGRGFGFSLFADDGAIWKRGRNLPYLFNQIQGALEKVTEWANDWGFNISTEKTKCMVFGNKKKMPSQTIKLYNNNLEKVKYFKFLGMWLDERMTGKKHIEMVALKCGKINNVLRCVAGSDWGADRESMMMIYRAMIRSAIDYGCMVYGSAALSVLNKLDIVQAKALRVCCGALCTTPIAALLIEMGEMPLVLRRYKLGLKYLMKLKGQREVLPTKYLLSDHWEFMGIRNTKTNFAENLKSVAQEIGIRDVSVCSPVCRSVAPS